MKLVLIIHLLILACGCVCAYFGCLVLILLDSGSHVMGIKSREKPHKGDDIFAFNAKVSCICVLKEFIGGKA